MAGTADEMSSSSRLLTLTQAEQIISVLRTGPNESLPPYKNYIFKKYKLDCSDGTEKIVRRCDGKIVVSSAELPDIIRMAHEELKHADDKKTWFRLRETFGNISRLAVHEYINKCQKCIADRHLVYQTLFKSTKPDLENRGHVDIIEMPSDGMYRVILHYTLVKTSFCILRPIRNSSYEEIAFGLYCVFVDFGYPDVLQSHSRKFTSDIIKEVSKLSPEVLIINGKYKEEQQKFCIAVKEQMVNWMASNVTTKWTRGLPFVQWEVNNIRKQNASNTPFQSVFNRRSSLSISTFKDLKNLPAGVLYEEEIKPFLDFCMPVTKNTVVCNVTPKVQVITGINSRNNKLVAVENDKVVNQTLKRRAQSFEPDDSKKLKIIASFSLADDNQIMHHINNSMAASSVDLNKNPMPAEDISSGNDQPTTDCLLTEEQNSGIFLKEEPAGQPVILQTETSTGFDPIFLQLKSEPTVIGAIFQE